MSLTKEEILDFIANTSPSFSIVEKDEKLQYSMFTAPTQHIIHENLEYLIQYGIKCYNKFGNRSAIAYYIENMPMQERPKDAEHVKIEDIISKFKEWQQYNNL